VNRSSQGGTDKGTCSTMASLSVEQSTRILIHLFGLAVLTLNTLDIIGHSRRLSIRRRNWKTAEIMTRRKGSPRKMFIGTCLGTFMNEVEPELKLEQVAGEQIRVTITNKCFIHRPMIGQ